MSEMVFTKHLREGIKRGRITFTIRFWLTPRVKPGGRYPMDGGHVVVDSIEQIQKKDITKERAVRSGFDDVAHLLEYAKHGKGENIYLIRFHYLRAGEWDRTPSPGLAAPSPQLSQLPPGRVKALQSAHADQPVRRPRARRS